MRKNIIYLALIAMLTMAPGQANAQLGNILKKAKKAVEAVEQVTAPTTSTPTRGETQGVSARAFTQENGIMVQNPKAANYEVQLVGAYGISTSENYGKVYLALRVKMIDNKREMTFNGNRSDGTPLAVDQNGNSYKIGGSGWTIKPVAEGIYVNILLNGDNDMYLDVKKSAKWFQMIKMPTCGNFDSGCTIVFKNVPIQWDVTPE